MAYIYCFAACFSQACTEAVKYIKEHLTIKTADLGRDSIVNAARTSMSSKIIGSEMDFFSNLVNWNFTAIETE